MTSWKAEATLHTIHQALAQGHTVHIINPDKHQYPVWQYADLEQLQRFSPGQHQ